MKTTINNSDRQIALFLVELADVFGAEWTQKKTQAYILVLGSRLRAAHLLSLKQQIFGTFKFMPKPAEILEILDGPKGTPRQDAIRTVDQILSVLNSAQNPYEVLDEYHLYAMRNLMHVDKHALRANPHLTKNNYWVWVNQVQLYIERYNQNQLLEAGGDPQKVRLLNEQLNKAGN